MTAPPIDATMVNGSIESRAMPAQTGTHSPDGRLDEKHIVGSSIDGSERFHRGLSAAEDKKLMRRIDLHIVPMMVLFYLLSFLDRTNIGNARINGLATDLKLSDYNYRIALTILYVPYILAEIPANILVKRIGANKYVTHALFRVCDLTR